eukprot:m.14120 g.14120  ORF g.14120 m.14120 type:complete len:54 (-) comp7696_c0_seq1:92-253(-)
MAVNYNNSCAVFAVTLSSSVFMSVSVCVFLIIQILTLLFLLKHNQIQLIVDRI